VKIDELEKLSGQPRRNIRFLISEDIVPEPYSKGRGATYGSEHVRALEIYTQMKASGVTSLDVIRDRVRADTGPQAVRAFAAAAPPQGFELAQRGRLQEGEFIEINPCEGVELKITASVIDGDELETVIGKISAALVRAADNRKGNRK